MKIKKILFSLIAISVPLTTVCSVAVSCTYHDYVKELKEWTNFKNAANKSKNIDIINATKVSSWAGLTESDFVRTNYKVDETKKIISLNINRILPGNIVRQAKFNIKFLDDIIYSINSWECISQPNALIAHSWEAFKTSALSATLNALFAQSREGDVLYNLRWKYGTNDAANLWRNDDEAEFDMFGALPDQAKNTYQGMNGKLTVDEDNKTITGIFCKNQFANLFESDPVKVQIHYSPNQAYNISDWKYSAIPQLESIERLKWEFDNLVTKTKQHMNETIANNWIYFPENPGDKTDAEKHGANFKIKPYLEDHSYPNARDFEYRDSKFDSGDGDDSLFKASHCVSTLRINFVTYKSGQQQALLTMKFYSEYYNGTNENDGLEPFNFIWGSNVKLTT